MPHMTTYSGRRVSLEEGVPTLEDIAIAMCRTPLFVGATKSFYSLAHHTLHVAELMPSNKIYGLLHEAEVVVFGDCPGPLKTTEHRKNEKQVRDRIIAIMELKPITSELWTEIEEADQLELAAVARVFGIADGKEIWPEEKYPRIEEAMQNIKELMAAFPPEKQLSFGSPLMQQWIKVAENLLRDEKNHE